MDGFESEKPRRPSLEYPFGREAPTDGELIEVAPGIFWTTMALPFALKFINVWLIDDGDGWTVVDTGLPLDETKANWRKILDARVTPEKPLKRVFVTHMHPDHVGSAGWLHRKYGAELWMSRLEYVTCRMLIADTGREAPAAGIDFFKAAGWSEASLADYRKRFGGFGRGVSQMPDSFRRLEDGDRFTMAGQEWEVITGSGHSPEHACLFCPALNVVISGDQLLPRISSNVSVHPTEPDANPLEDWLVSCEKLMQRLPEDVLVLPAHNEPFTGAHKRLQHLIDGHHVALERLSRRLAESPRSVIEIFPAVFGRAIKDDEVSMATGEAIAHLNYLLHTGRAQVAPDADGINRYSMA